ncbi:MAG: cell envelope integrity EipB family protein [Rhodospirillales bacterium]|nr:cell envelope integrity EipB family protein [Rhodospirillales bacterium]
MRHVILAAALLLGLSPRPGQAAEPLAAHKALYDLTLESARGDVIAASGSMAYEVTDACDAWAVRQRLKMSLTNRDGQDIEMISDYTTWESKDGLKMRFRLRQTTDDAVTSELSGDAALDHTGGPGEVHYDMPADTTKKLPPGTLFPMMHTEALLQAAEAGKKFLALPLFDGTGPDGAQDTAIAITGWAKPAATNWPVLTPLPSTRVRIGFFDRGKHAQVPDYEVGMHYWSNGIADDLSMDFGDFVMHGKLSSLTLPAKPSC